MTDLDFVADLIEARAHQYGSSYLAVQDKTWKAEQVLCAAQSEALKELAKEIRASIPAQGQAVRASSPNSTRRLWAFSTEIGGIMSARLFTDQEAAKAAQNYFMQKYGMENE